VPRIVVTQRAAAGLFRCRRYLASRNVQAAKRASQAIERHFVLLETAPNMGRPVAGDPQWRELVIPFGDAGYVALYRYEPDEGVVYILAFRHQREAGY